METAASHDILNEFNPFHDKNGRFSTHNGATFTTTKTKSGKDVSHIAKKHAATAKAKEEASKPKTDPRTEKLPENHPVRRMSPEHQKMFHDAYEKYSQVDANGKPKHTLKSELGEHEGTFAQHMGNNWVDAANSQAAIQMGNSLRRLGLSDGEPRKDLMSMAMVEENHNFRDSDGFRGSVKYSLWGPEGHSQIPDAYPGASIRIYKLSKETVPDGPEPYGERYARRTTETKPDVIIHPDMDRMVIHMYADTQARLARENPTGVNTVYRGSYGSRASELGRSPVGTELREHDLHSQSTSRDVAKFFSDTEKKPKYRESVITRSSVPNHEVFIHHNNSQYASFSKTTKAGGKYGPAFNEQKEMVVFGRRMRVKSRTNGKPPEIELEPV
jgi:hypothetical protein